MIGKRIADKLREANLSPTDLAKMSGVPQPTIHRIISGESRSPRQHNIEKIAKTLGVSLNWLWTGKKDLAFPDSPQSQATEDGGQTPVLRAPRAKLELKIKHDKGSTAFSSLESSDLLTLAIQPFLDRYVSELYADEPQLLAALKQSRLTEIRLHFTSPVPQGSED